MTHFHPVGFCALFAKKVGVVDVEAFLALYEQAHTSFAPGTPSLNSKSKANLREILAAINSYYAGSEEVAGLYELAYMLATVRHETYYPSRREYFSAVPEYGDMAYFNKYDPVLAKDESDRLKARAYGNQDEGDGYKYRGRGLVHLTWKANYQKLSELLGVDLVADPDKAAELKYSLPIMIIGMTRGSFTGKKLSHYFSEDKKSYKSARYIINAQDESELIASYAERFELILMSAGDFKSRGSI